LTPRELALKYMTLIVAVGALCALPQNASAQLTGYTLTAEWWYPDQGVVLESHDIVVSDGLELGTDEMQNSASHEIDVGRDYVEFRFVGDTFWTDRPFNGWAFTDTMGVLPPFRGYTVDSFSSGLTGVNGIVFGFTDDQFWASFSALEVTQGDWLRLALDVEPIGTPYCSTNVNSTGVAGALSGIGSSFVSSNSLMLQGSDLPAGAATLFLVSSMDGFASNPGGSSGNLCLGNMIGRYVGPGELQTTDASGAASLAIDLTAIPTPSGSVVVSVGETWYFQAWHRDLLPTGGTTSNLPNGLSIIFE